MLLFIFLPFAKTAANIQKSRDIFRLYHGS